MSAAARAQQAAAYQAERRLAARLANAEAATAKLAADVCGRVRVSLPLHGRCKCTGGSGGGRAEGGRRARLPGCRTTQVRRYLRQRFPHQTLLSSKSALRVIGRLGRMRRAGAVTLPDMSLCQSLTHLLQPCSRSRPAGFVLWPLKLTLHCGATLVAALPAYAAVMAAWPEVWRKCLLLLRKQGVRCRGTGGGSGRRAG